MKAAVIHQLGATPAVEDVDAPQPQNAGEALMQVQAVAIKNLDKARVAGTHYSNYTQFPAVVGMDAVGTLPDGRLVYAQGISGTLAAQAVVDAEKAIALPENISAAEAAALPNAAIGAALALRFRAEIRAGETVVVNGATGVTGQLAVQLAKHYGAKTVIATGRNEEALAQLKTLGADETVNLKEDMATRLQTLFTQHPPDIILDYLWGETVETLLSALPKGGIGRHTHPVRLVTVGDMAGKSINLTSGMLRSTDIRILGSGYGSLSKEDFALYESEVLPEMFALLAEGRISVAVETHPLSAVAAVWHKALSSGKRLVFELP